MLKITQKQRIHQTLSLKQKFVIASSLVALVLFIILFLINNLASIHTTTGAGILQLYSKSNTSLQFNGTTSTASAGSVDFNFNKQLTINAWVKWDTIPSTGNGWANIVSMNSDIQSDRGQFWIQHNSNNSKFEFAVSTESSRKFVTSTTTPVAQTWYHISGVYNDGNMYIYINGIQEGTITQTEKVTANQAAFKFVIGGWAYTSGGTYRRFKGEIDEVSVWNKALTITNIRDIMCAPTPSNSSGLRGYWNMNNISGNTIIDRSGRNVTLTKVNTIIKLSGAPIGIKSKWVFGNNISSLSFSHPNGDQLTVDSLSAAIGGLNIYYTDTLVNYDSILATTMVPVRKFSWGIFNSTGNAVNYKISYTYQVNTDITDENLLAVNHKKENDSITWTNGIATLNTSVKTISFHLFNRREVALYQRRSSTPLPVTFSDIFAEANSDKKSVLISWTTLSEINNNNFTIERSIDGSNFNSIGTVKGAGNSNKTLHYNFTDNDPKNELMYYRIRQTDYDGKSATSKNVVVELNNSALEISEILVYPNPCHDFVEVKLNSGKEGNVFIKITNHAGQVVINEKYNCFEGVNNFRINSINSIAAGSYFVTISNDNKLIKSIKLIKQ